MRNAHFIIGILIHFSSVAQVPFAQAIQAPLVLNPSMAGNKHNNRISAIYNQSSVHENRSSNYHLSFDTFLKRLGSGLGLYYIRQNYSSSAIPYNLREDNNLPELNSSLFDKQRINLFGLTFAPKFNIMDKTNPREIRYSVSPAVYVIYHDGLRMKTDNFRFAYTQICTCIDPNAKPEYDTASYTTSKVKEQLFIVGLGVMVNSDNLLFFLRIQHESGFYKDNFTLKEYHYVAGQSFTNQTVYNQKLYAVEGVAGLGVSIPKKKDAKFYITPFASIGFKRHLNLTTESKNETILYSQNFAGKSINEISLAHASLNFKVSYLIFGGAYTTTPVTNYYGASLGFQNSWSKTLATFNFVNNYTLAEIGTGVWF